MSSSATSRSRARSIVAIAAAIAVAAGTVLVGAPANAVPGGVISGVAEFEVSPGVTAPGAGVEVMFFPMSGSGEPQVAVADANGAYSISTLEQGPYRVLFSPGDPQSPYVAEWLGDTPHESDASTFYVFPENTSGVSNTLPLGGTISGTITSSSTTDDGAAAAFLLNEATYQWERFSRWANADSGGNYTITGLPEGEFLLRFSNQGDDALLSTEYWNDVPYWSEATLVEMTGTSDLTGYNATLASEGIDLVRLAGANRYSTGVVVSEVQWEQSEVVFITGGQSFPDALSAGPAAAHLGAPLLLTPAASLPASVTARLTELAPAFIFIVGGTGSVSDAVRVQLEEYASVGVGRVAGPNRYATSLEVASTFFEDSGANTAYLATGVSFPDALTAGPAAANEFAPVILVRGTDAGVSAETLIVLGNLGVKKIVIAGGTPTVSTGIEGQLRGSPSFTEVYRRAGANRYETSLKISQGSFPLTDSVFLATGAGFPDALAGAALAGHPFWRAPILLVRQNCVPAGVGPEIDRLRVAEVFILGGESSVGSGVANGVPCA